MLIFDKCARPGETRRKLRQDIILLSLSIRPSKSPLHCAFGSEDVNADSNETYQLEFQLLPYSEGLLENALRLTELSLYRTITGHHVLNIGWGPREGTLSLCVSLVQPRIPPCQPQRDQWLCGWHEQVHIEATIFIQYFISKSVFFNHTGKICSWASLQKNTSCATLKRCCATAWYTSYLLVFSFTSKLFLVRLEGRLKIFDHAKT